MSDAAIREYMKRLADDPNATPPDGLHVHITKSPAPCDHEWDQWQNPNYCVKCGMSLIAHAFMECP